LTPVILSGDPRVRRYDFNHQEAIDRARLRRLQPVFDALAHRMAGSLTGNLRRPVHITAVGFEQAPWEEYAGAMEDPTFLASASVIGPDGRFVLHLPVELVLALVDIQLGGEGGAQPERLTLTDIEHALAGSLVEDLFAVLPTAFDAFIDLGIGVIQTTRSSIYLKLGRPGEMCLLVELRLGLGDAPDRTLHLCIPLTVLHPILEAFERLQNAEGRELPTGSTTAQQRLLEVPVDLEVAYPSIGLTPTELLGLRVGDVISLHQDKEETPSHDIVVGGVLFGRGVLVERGKRLACTITNSMGTGSMGPGSMGTGSMGRDWMDTSVEKEIR
jgi:flagellar motor switch protein FliM